MSRETGGKYPFERFEPTWQERWEAERLFHADRDERRPKWFIMELPPFANGKLHLGHVRNYVIADVSARFRRMAGFNVMYTTGFDSFGLPNENAARDAGVHPRVLAEQCMEEMRPAFVRLGLSHDTRRIIAVHDPAYYKWVQWVFLRLVEAGLAFRKKAKVNWCSTCATALADSLVDGGACWRCGKPVESRVTEQWFVREQGFAEALLEGFKTLDGWPETVKRIQTDWIGRREGVEARFEVVSPGARGDGAPAIAAFVEGAALVPSVSFVAVGPGHPALEELRRRGLLSEEEARALDERERWSLATREARRQSLNGGGALVLRARVRHPLDGAELPLLVLDSLEGSDGAVAGCPEHVQGDRRVAEEMGLALHRTAGPARTDEEILGALEAAGLGGRAVRYRLRDWNIARQRYWGTPVPIVHCSGCGAVPVKDEDLPVLLPEDVSLDAPGSPLEHHQGFVSTSCPRCGAPARRDTDTLEAYSSPWWYHWNCRTLGLPGDNPFDPADTRYWMPVDLMVGGIDQTRTCFFHTRMVDKALKQLGHALHDEPVTGLLAIGMVKQGGRKMSKSAGNLVDPDALARAYGVDALRVGMMGAAAPPSDMSWSDQVVKQAHGFLADVWGFLTERREWLRLEAVAPERPLEVEPGTALRGKLASWLSTGAERISGNLARNDLHLSVKNLVFLFERLVQFERDARARTGTLDPKDAGALAVGTGALLRLLAPLAPHIAEELWQLCGGRGLVASAPWPVPLPERDPEEVAARGTGRPGASRRRGEQRAADSR
ncbi:MAG TPA: class I tRNA ligase family protein [Myxococcaceae bacterium]|nr:class I tRNA ligase family protein [Myxococcaceae bacterium]